MVRRYLVPKKRVEITVVAYLAFYYFLYFIFILAVEENAYTYITAEFIV